MVILRRYGWILKDIKKRSSYRKYEIRKRILRSLIRSICYTIFYKLYFTKLFYKFPKKASISCYTSACSFSFFGRSVSRKFKVSRHFFKFLLSKGYITGLKKSSF